MIRNYLKTAFRNLLREKTTTLLNLCGLTLGIACSIILTLIILHHSSFDNFHANRERIYRVVFKAIGNNQQEFQSGVPAPLPEAFAMDFPEAEKVVFTSYRASSLITIPGKGKEDKRFVEEQGVVFTEPSFFSIFDQPLIAGVAATALDDPNEAIISNHLAVKYFGRHDVIGETLIYDGAEFKISAIMADPPANTDFPFHLMLSYITIKQPGNQQNWYSIWSDEHCYFLLKEGEQIESIQSRLPLFSRKYRNHEQDKGEFMVLPVSEMHFDGRFETYTYQTVPRHVLITLGIIAVILILTGCINFINLATADAIKRSREVGVRKTLGSTKAQLIIQFLGETTLVTILAVVFSLALAQVALGFVNPFLELNLALNLAENPMLLIFLLGVTIFVSLFSGLYPALIISSYNPALALKNKISNRSSAGFYVRALLVVFQFFISQFFIIGSIVLIKQTDFFLKSDMGFSKEAVLIVPIPDNGERDREKLSLQKKTFKHEVSRIAGVHHATLASAAPFSGDVNKTIFKIQDDPTEYVTQYKQIDDQYLDFYKINLIAGINLGASDTLNGVVVNESVTRTCGFSPEDIIGKIIYVNGKNVPVLGVVSDFNTTSLRNKIEPTLLFNQVKAYKTIALKVNTHNVDAVVNDVKTKWQTFYPEHIFDYSFLEENIRSFYDGQRKMTSLLSSFSMIAIFIGCLGLFGLVSYMTNQKTKEIGVRKVMGATVENILLTFSWGYVKLIFFGFLLAIPVAWFTMQQFLNEYAYKISLSPWIFIVAFLITLSIALVTVGYKSFRTAIADPIHSLRYE